MPTTGRFADTIRKAIRIDGRTLYRLGRDTGIDVAVLQRFMSGERGINLATAERLCSAVGLVLRTVSRPTKKVKDE